MPPPSINEDVPLEGEDRKEETLEIKRTASSLPEIRATAEQHGRPGA